MTYEGDGDTNLNSITWKRDCRNLRYEEELMPSKLQYRWDQLKYWEESWRGLLSLGLQWKPLVIYGLKKPEKKFNVYFFHYYSILSDWFCLFNGISNFVCYLMLKPNYRRSRTFFNDIFPKMNVMTWLEFELTFFEATVHHLNHYVT